MKKYSLMLIAIIFIIPIGINASTPNYKKIKTSLNDNYINYIGTTNKDTKFVYCSLLNSKNEEKSFVVNKVSNKHFSGNFKITKGKYQINCIDNKETKYLTNIITY